METLFKLFIIPAMFCSLFVQAQNTNSEQVEYRQLHELSQHLYDTCKQTREKNYGKLYNIGLQSKYENNRQFVVNMLLDVYFMYPDYLYAPFDFKRSDFNDTARQKIITLITRPKTELEIELYLYDAWNRNKKNNINQIDLETKAELKNSERSYEIVYDSIKNWYLNNWKENFINRKSPSLYKAIGWLEMKDQIPFLEGQLQDSTVINYPDKELIYWITASLIRMGQTKYYTDRFKNDDYLSWFLMQQEGYKSSIKDLYSERTYMCLSDGTEIKAYLDVIEKMQREFLNYPKWLWLNGDSFDWCVHDPLKNKPSNFLERIRKWAKKHEGKYKINPDCYF